MKGLNLHSEDNLLEAEQEQFREALQNGIDLGGFATDPLVQSPGRFSRLLSRVSLGHLGKRERTGAPMLVEDDGEDVVHDVERAVLPRLLEQHHGQRHPSGGDNADEVSAV